MQNNKYIAFIDILGFKDLVNNNDHDALVKKFQNLFTIPVELSLSGGEHKNIESQGSPLLVADLNKANVNSLVISDNAIFWTDDDGMQSFINLCAVVMKLICSGIFVGFPLRGAISMGQLSVIRAKYESVRDNSQQTLLGKGLVKAYELETNQDWVGCVVDEACISKYQEHRKQFSNVEDLATLDYLIESGVLCKYEVPYKSGNKEEYVINWVKGSKEPPSENTVRKSFSMHNKLTTDNGVKVKIENTIKFLRAVLKTKT